MEVEDRTCSVPRPCLLRRRLQMLGILSIKKRHKHCLSIQSPGSPRSPSLEPEQVERDEPAPHFRTFEPKPPTRDGIQEPKQLS
ncbi:hypothetical protein DCAR_0100192 [Daucus carota subsp. sativus]|uniref:Uncharacterized protein n=1 Tax=Daucus carota subsp. sativus TaxID=79200 RepID=A0AAF1AHW3_DAUCS|nr:hypothetical protein DCAR_0100192 [Daucus carota subsp. sativus]